MGLRNLLAFFYMYSGIAGSKATASLEERFERKKEQQQEKSRRIVLKRKEEGPDK